MAEPVETPAAATEETKTKKPERADKRHVDKAVDVLNAGIDKINEEIAVYDKQIDEIKKQIEVANNARSGQQDEISKERQKRDEIRAELDAAKRERDHLQGELERLKGKVDSALESNKNAKAQMRFRTVEEIDAEISRLEKQQSTTSMSLAEEKRLIKDIEVLRGQKKQLATLGQSSDQITRDKDERTRVSNLLKAKRDQVNEINTRLKAQYEVLDNLGNKDGDKKGKIPTLIEQRKAIYEKKKEAVGRIQEIRKQIKEKWDEFRAKKKEWEDWMDEERKVREAERKARQEEYQRKLEEEEAKKVPYEEEMALCDFLVNYLKQTFLTDDGSNPAAAETAAVPGAASFELDGVVLQAYKRDEEDEENWGAAAKKKKGAGANKKSKAKKETIVHSADTMASFAHLHLEAPAKIAAVEESIVKLTEKKAWYSVQPRPVRKVAAVAEGEEKAGESQNQVKENAEKGKKKSKAPKEFKSSEGDFPELSAAAPKPATAAAAAVEA